MKLIAIDVSSIAYRAWHTIKQQNNATYGVLRQLRLLQEYLDITKLVFCFDSRTHKRRELYPEYKGNRTAEGKEDLHRQLDELRQSILPGIGFHNVFHQEGYESDDLIGALCKNNQHEIVIVSTDTDMWQLLNDQISIWNPATKAMFTEDIFRDAHDMNPKQWINVKAIMGDTGDNIPGVQGVGEVLATRYVRCEHIPNSKSSDRIRNSETMIDLNIQLIKLPFPGTRKPTLLEDTISREAWVRETNKYGLQEHHCPVY